MTAIMYICLALFALGIVMELREQRRINRRRFRPHVPLAPPRNERISVICMDCGMHMSGPHPYTTTKLSHGLCPKCSARWRDQFLSVKDPIIERSRH